MGKTIIEKIIQAHSDEEVEAELRAFAKESLAAYKVPKLYEFVEAIPLTSVGKVDKKVMRKKD